MLVKYSEHLETRLGLRKIEYNLPRIIYDNSEERYFDEQTGYFIAIMKVVLYNRERETMVAYTLEKNQSKILTIHPLKDGQKENRVISGRWRII